MYAVSLESGVPLPGWAQTYPQNGRYVAPNTWGSALRRSSSRSR